MMVSREALDSHLAYSAWATRRLLDAASELTAEELARDFGTADKSVLGTFVHIFRADRIWLARVTGQSGVAFAHDGDGDFVHLRREWPILQNRWRTWLASLPEDQIDLPFCYTDLSGREWRTPLWQIVMHVVNHATHHRGQVSGFLRALGRKPPALDLVAFYRESGA